uniref:Uncharacterized protein n=1 Tax=Arundo donax TaxID=35708 RepID=A0A0A9FHT3_ARUDO
MFAHRSKATPKVSQLEVAALIPHLYSEFCLGWFQSLLC